MSEARLNASLIHLSNASSSADNSSLFDRACSYTNDYGHSVLHTAHTALFVASIVFIVVGLVGNALSVRVFCVKHMREVLSNVYLLSLAVSDSVYLLTIFLSRTLTTLRCWCV